MWSILSRVIISIEGRVIEYVQVEFYGSRTIMSIAIHMGLSKAALLPARLLYYKVRFSM